MNDDDPVVEVRDLTRSFRGGAALREVSMSVARDSITGLLGRNGAGKTTLMSLITGQDFATSGEVRVFGEHPLENERVLSRTCFIRESQQYPNNFRVHHVLAAGANFHDNWDAELAASLVEAFDLPMRRQVAKLSRGMRSSLGILVGLASRAPLTLFDEPYLGLDASARRLFYDVLLADYAEHPRTIVLSTHLIDEVSNLLEDVVVLDAGRVVIADSAEALRNRACVLSGPVAAVDALAGGLVVLDREAMGAYVRLTVQTPSDHELVECAASVGVEVSPVSLQSLVVDTGRSARAATPRPEGAHR